MTSYIAIVPKYLSAHKKKTTLVITGVAIAVALVTAIFSMLDSFLQFMKIQYIHEYGNYHLGVRDATVEEKQAIAARIDVQNAGTWISFRNGSLNGRECRLAALDEGFAPNMQITLLEGKYPTAKDEMMLEEWAAESLRLRVGDVAKITFAGDTGREFRLSGIYRDYGDTKAEGVPGVYLSVAAANETKAEKASILFIEFKRGVDINDAQRAIQNVLKLGDERIVRNEYLLAVMGFGKSKTIMGLYATGVILFCLVLVAGVVMIYNTFNISVIERVQQFGLLRCIGASRSQVKRLVNIEGLHITLRAIPIGVLAGMLVAVVCSAILKFYNSSLFGEMPLFRVSTTGIIAGIVVGLLTVFIASFLPARKAANVSPISAITGSEEIKISRKRKQGLLTKLLRVETAMGIGNAVVRKKTFILMSCSIAIGIVLFLGFQAYVDFMYTALKTTKPYTPDITLMAEQERGLSRDLYRRLGDLSGVKNVYGRMLAYVDATFDITRLTDAYKKIVGDVPATNDGLFIPPEKSLLVSYDRQQLSWARIDLIAGQLSEEKLNDNNGVVAVAQPLRKGVGIQTAALQLGDKVYVQTPNGTREMTVMAILRKVPFSDSELTLTTFITTEKLFTELTGESTLDVIDIQLDRSGQEQSLRAIKGMLDDSISLLDHRQRNAEVNRYFLTVAVFVYGFVAVIALVSVLNIINTMNTSVASRTRYLGVMRAVGMSARQLRKMVLVEALTYSLTGGITGCVVGTALQRTLIDDFLPLAVWRFPYMHIVVILIALFSVTVISIIGPLKRIKSKGIAEVIASL